MSTTVIHVASSKDIPSGFTGIAIYPDGTKEWWLNGHCHREDGPAIEWSDGKKEWWSDNTFVCNNLLLQSLDNNFIILERGIPTDNMFGELKLTQAKLLTSTGVMLVYDNLPGGEIGEGNE
jgi:hypothetical protein